MMNFKRVTLASALLASFALSATAMEAIEDEQLSQVSGQDGVSIIADLHVNVGSVVYGDDDGLGTVAELRLENVQTDGLVIANVDVLTAADFTTEAMAIAAGYGVTDAIGLFTEVATVTGYTNGDVAKISFPALTHAEKAAGLVSISVGSIKTGNGAGASASMGSLAVNQIDMGGTSVYIFGH